VKEWLPLYKKEIDTQGDMLVFIHDWHGEGKRNERWHLDGTSFCCLPFDGGDVGSVDEHCMAGILHSHWAVLDEIVV